MKVLNVDGKQPDNQEHILYQKLTCGGVEIALGAASESERPKNLTGFISMAKRATLPDANFEKLIINRAIIVMSGGRKEPN